MKQIRLTYRAQFRQPIGVLNPMNCKMPAVCPVEVFKRGDHWLVREIASPKRYVYERLSDFISADRAKEATEAAFQEQVTDWQTWGAKGFSGTEVQIDPEELQQIKGQWYIKEPEDYTHIMHDPPAREKGPRTIPPAACGAMVPGKAFISNKANVEPTCKACAVIWREHYQEKGA